MRVGYLIVAVISLSPCIVASLHAISKIWGSWWLIPAGMIIGAGIITAKKVLTRSDKKGPGSSDY